MPRPVKGEDIGWKGESKLDTSEHIFKQHGDQWFSLTINPAGIVFDARRLRRERHELHGELSVTVNGNFPHAKTHDGVVLSGDFNFSSIETRQRRAKFIGERAGAEALDFYGFLEELSLKLIAADRRGQPSVVLADCEKPPKDDVWHVDGWPVLKRHPMIVFGDGASGKSYWALFVVATLAERGVSVLYADWEFANEDHRERLEQMFPVMPRNVRYLKCWRPMEQEAERIRGELKDHGIQYLVCDSVAVACGRRPEEAEEAVVYFRAIRSFDVGSLHVAHISKSTDSADDSRTAKPFGSAFWWNGARSIWYVRRSESSPKGEIRMGLYHRKSNTSQLLEPRAYRLVFRNNHAVFQRAILSEIDDLEAGLPMFDRIKRVLEKGALTIKAISDELGSSPAAIRTIIGRHSKSFTRVGNKVGLAEEPEDGTTTTF